MRTDPRFGVAGWRWRAARPDRARRPGVPTRRTDSRGAAVVEFGLVMPIFLMLVVGILDYGLWFNDANSTRHGVREAARMAVVDNYAATACAPTSSAIEKSGCLIDLVEDEVAAVGGPTYVRVVAPPAWAPQQPLLVCAVVADAGVTGLLPMPNGGQIRAKARMAVEVADSSGVASGTTPGAPADINWASWCA